MATTKRRVKEVSPDENEAGAVGETVVTTVTKTRQVADENEGEIEADPLAAAIASGEESEAAALADVLTGLDAGSEVKLMVYRQPGNGQQKSEFLFSIGAMDMGVDELLTKIQDEYGGGTFRIWGRQNGMRAALFNRQVSIATPIKKNALSPTADKSAEVIERIYAQKDAQMAELMKAIVSRPQADNSALFKLLAPILTALAPKIVDMMLSRSDPMSQFSVMLGLLEKVKPLMGDQPAPEGIMGLAQQFMPMIQSAIEGMKNAPQQQALPQNFVRRQMAPIARQMQAPIAAPSQVPIAPVSRAGNHESSSAPVASVSVGAGTLTIPVNAPDPFAELRPYLKMLLSGAARQVDPGDFAIGLMDVMPQEILDALAPLVQSAEAFEMLFTIEPKLASARQWCDAVRQQLLEHLDPAPHVPTRNPGGPSAPVNNDGQAVGGRDGNSGNPDADDAPQGLGKMSA